MNQQENFSDLIKQATGMLLDRSEPEQELIYYMCKMENDLRAAIVVAYEMLHNED